MRYDLKVYDLEPLTLRVDALRDTMLALRRALKPARKMWEDRLTEWWTAYKQLANSSGTQPFWVYEFVR